MIVVQIQNISLLDSLSVQVIKESAEGELPTFLTELSTPTEVRSLQKYLQMSLADTESHRHVPDFQEGIYIDIFLQGIYKFLKYMTNIVFFWRGAI